MQTVTTSADFAGGTEVTEPHPIIAFLLASSSHLPLEIANLGSAEIGVRDARVVTHRSVSAVNSLDCSHSTDLTDLQGVTVLKLSQ